jgi:hypothetical protein
MFTVEFPVKRPFNLRVFVSLVALYFLGNLAGVPLLQMTNTPIEPIWFWGAVTFVAAIVIALSLAISNSTSLGAPLIEGRLSKADLPSWLRSGLALTIVMLIVGFPLGLIANLGANPDTYAFGWQLLPASFKAGVVEEIVNRLFLVSFFVWLGRFFKRNIDGRPARSVYWIAILLAGILFGWAHVDARLGHPTATTWDFALIMIVNSSLGIYFGWLFWKLGLEWAMFAHFVNDVFISMVVIPVHLLKNPVAYLVLLAGLAALSVIALRFLMKPRMD